MNSISKVFCPSLRFALLASTAALTFPAATVMAQTAATQPIAPKVAEDDTRKLEDIVVTAQKRGQNLQEVPVAVSAFTGVALTQAGVNTVKDIAQVDPSLNIGSGSGVVLPFLRGVGNPSGFNVGNEASVPVYIDDVYYTRLAPAYLELSNVARVEVLKGPQGTLFGRNASGGAIQIFTRDPGSSPALEATAGYGNYDTFSGKLYAAAPIADDIAADLAISGLHQGDGWGQNIATGEPTYRNQYINVRSKLFIDAAPTTRIRLSGFYVAQRTGQGLQNSRYRGTFGATPPLPSYGPIVARPALDFYDSEGTFNTFVHHRGWGGSLKIDQELGFADLVSISAYRRAKEMYLAEGDTTAFNFLRYELNAVDRQITQEFQLKSRRGSSFDWILGAYYLNSRQGYSPTRVTGDAFGTGNALNIFGIQTVKSYSGYGQATFHVIPENTNITLGLRYTSDHVHGEGRQTFETPAGTFPFLEAAGGQAVFDNTFVFNKLTYKVAVDHQFAEQVMGYVSFSRGYKSGTFNTLPLITEPSHPEIVDAYEVGLKTELFDRRLRLNLAVFQNNIKSPQVSTVISRGTTAFVGLTNAESAKSRGVELSVDTALASGLRVRFSGSYLDAKYTSFVNAPFNFPVTALPQNGGTCPGATVGSPVVPATTGGLCPTVVRNANGNTLAQVPDWRFSGGINYTLDTMHGKFLLDVNAAYTGRFAWDADNFIKQRPYALLNSSLTYQLPDSDRYSVRVWGKNLTGTRYYATELPVSGGSGYTSGPAAPRTYGVELIYRL